MFTLAELEARAAKAQVAKDNLDPLESDIEEKVGKYAKNLGWWHRKFTSPANRSVPDRIFAKNGRVFFIEFKRKGKEASDAQADEHKDMRKQGLTVYVVDNVVDGNRIIDEENAWA